MLLGPAEYLGTPYLLDYKIYCNSRLKAAAGNNSVAIDSATMQIIREKAQELKHRRKHYLT